MPEMPEVETILVGLRRTLEGATVLEAYSEEACDRRVTSLHLSEGLTIKSLSRRGKALMVHLDGGSAISVHLGMTGRLVFGGEVGETRHIRATIRTDRGYLVFSDPRRFGRIGLQGPGDEDPLVSVMGPEVADITSQQMLERLSLRTKAIKSVLLDQRILAGIGNIYADEALWEAIVHPETRSCALTESDAERLLTSAKRILAEAVARGGSSIKDYRRADGERGTMQGHLRCYGRYGLPCMRCGTALTRKRVSGRGSTFCPSCQQVR